MLGYKLRTIENTYVADHYRPSHVEDGLLVVDGEVWAYFRLPTHGWELLSEGEQHARLAESERLIRGLRKATCILHVAPRLRSVEEWSAQMRAVPNPTEGWAEYLDEVEAHLGSERSQDREVYLGVKIASPDGLLAKTAEAVKALRERRGRMDPLSDADLATARKDVGRTLTRVEAGCTGSRLATAAEIDWLCDRPFGGGPREMESEGYRRVALKGGGYLATLGLSYMPNPMPFPGAAWLHTIDRLEFPVAATVRFDVMPTADAVKHAEAVVAAAADMHEHMAQAGTVPLDVTDAYEGARHLARDLRAGNLPLVYAWPRFVVSAETVDELEERVLALQESALDSGLVLPCPGGDQAALLVEGLPGSRFRTPSYRQVIPPVTLAGSMYAASAEVGDPQGPYFGDTIGVVRRRVLLDPLRAAREDQSPVISLTGTPGSGKTLTATKLVIEARMRGATAVVLGSKAEDVEPLYALPGLGDKQMIRFDERYEGALDPYAIEAERADAVLLAAEMCRVFLPPSQSRASEGEILSAVGAAHSMRDVVRRLLSSEDPVGRKAGETLVQVAGLPLARMCFGEDSGRRMRLLGSLSIIRLDNLGLPSRDSDPEDYSIPERLAVGLLRGVTATVGQMLVAADRHQPKLVHFDEAWALLASADGRRLLERFARIGRARNLTTLMATQSAADLGDQRIQNCISVRLGFRSEGDEEIRMMLGSLGVEATVERVAKVRGLRSGQCFLRDLEGRVGVVQVHILPALLERLRTTPKEEVA